ncbi:PhzF family phenazine biosynthesis protein [Cyclobacterium jeungdonense]|uniref:PhzF family phenazine biosynthesis protein n=1 Tax=Cyclobacterium jeungdonense TaxID=708087 RepID=A0ABT8CE29_9BACT|nr:PhzF family phenazine biosynthesis protein [Cyclobacterium jeungdonense]MDN3690442.1 PhzF family phenazine biosynthesis protein [Cyclobacterium jeungdonense]
MTPTVIAVFTAEELGFKGNPAAVLLSKSRLSDNEMQEQAQKIGMPATSFLFEDREGNYRVRWFAPDEEIGLCGHGAAAAGIFLAKETGKEKITLQYGGGEISVKLKGNTFFMTLEGIPVMERIVAPQAIEDGLKIPILEMYITENKHLIVSDSEASVAQMKPDFARLRQSSIFGYAVTALGDRVDFVSRTLVPHVQQLEDHATGSSHALLVPYWAAKLGKKRMESYQLSPRGGRFFSELIKDKVVLSGNFEME